MIPDFRAALRNFLLADPDVSAAIGGARIYPVVLPQEERNPSIVYTRISGLGDHNTEGPSGLNRPRVQIDAYAQKAGDADALARMVKFRLDGYSGPMSLGGSPETFVQVQGVFFDTEREDYQADVKLYRSSKDYLIWFEER